MHELCKVLIGSQCGRFAAIAIFTVNFSSLLRAAEPDVERGLETEGIVVERLEFETAVPSVELRGGDARWQLQLTATNASGTKEWQTVCLQ